MDEKQASTTKRPVVLEGEQVALGPFGRELVPLYAEWMNDERVARPYIAPDPWHPTDPRIWAVWYEQARQDPTRMLFAIYERATGRPIGSSGLHEIDPRTGTATLSLVIGAVDVWGRGYGTEAVRLMLAYAFRRLGLRRVRLQVAASNQRAIRVYERAGFRVVQQSATARSAAGTDAQVIMICASPARRRR